MVNYFGGFNNDNPLAQYLRQYVPQQSFDAAQNVQEPQRMSNDTAPYEINSQSELEYIVPDKSGRKQIVDCPSENKVYVGRYNHVRQLMDWRSYIDEGEISLSKNNDTSAEMSQIAEALVAVADKLDSMYNEIQEFKKIDTKIDKPNTKINNKAKTKDDK